MRKLAHIGIPVKEKPSKGTYLSEAKLYITSPEDSKNNIEFLFFEEECQMPDIVKTNTHVAYFVDDLDAELDGAQVLIPPFEPMPGVRCAFILEDSCVPVELMQQS
ncbi:MAG: hypothetical protein DBX55_00420 [Verrucomicrobia bacterium]|nr:MAG: hypothetical protein DBX55_00420 [Verrucomicrobiota bacterium]